MAKSWKDALLSSGLPLESDVRNYMSQHGCLAEFEHSYLRADEARVLRQFSYDIDASLIQPPHFVDFLVECKYRHPSVSWIFTPDEYGGHTELGPNDFMHPLTHFVERRCVFDSSMFPRHLAPCCSKGIEVTSEGANEKAVAQAVSQLAFGMARRVGDAVEHQAHDLLRGDFVFYHLPVIVTSAALYRLRDGVTIDSIRAASEMSEVADAVDLLVLRHRTGVELRAHNAATFAAVRANIGDEELKAKLQPPWPGLDHAFEVLAGDTPRAIVVVSTHRGWQGMDHLFGYVQELLNPSPALLSEMHAQVEGLQAMIRGIEARSAKTGHSAPNKALQPTSRASEGGKVKRPRRAARG
jgi:hypothetical protein